MCDKSDFRTEPRPARIAPPCPALNPYSNSATPNDLPEPSVPHTLLNKALFALLGCAVAFLIILGLLTALPHAVRDALPDGVLGGAVITLGLAAAHRFTGRPR